MLPGARRWRKTNVRAACGTTMTWSGPQEYSRTIDFIAAHAAIVSWSSGVGFLGLPSIIGSSSCLTWPSSSLIQPPLHPSRRPPHTTAASMVAMTSVDQVLVAVKPSRPAVVRSKDRSGPSKSGVSTSSTHRENRCSFVIFTRGLARSQKMQTSWGMASKVALAPKLLLRSLPEP